MRTCNVCLESKPNNKFTRNPKANKTGEYWYKAKCNKCVHSQNMGDLLTQVEFAANNYISGSDKWFSNGVIMNLGLPSIQYRVKL